MTAMTTKTAMAADHRGTRYLVLFRRDQPLVQALLQLYQLPRKVLTSSYTALATTVRHGRLACWLELVRVRRADLGHLVEHLKPYALFILREPERASSGRCHHPLTIYINTWFIDRYKALLKALVRTKEDTRRDQRIVITIFFHIDFEVRVDGVLLSHRHHQVAVAGDVARQDGHTHRHRLEHRAALPLTLRGIEKALGHAHQRAELLLAHRRRHHHRAVAVRRPLAHRLGVSLVQHRPDDQDAKLVVRVQRIVVRVPNLLHRVRQP
mmetsp:Transcript_81032/g.230059  ORF Transcript_81032/g.230059 Transcript_81032/m.230059 type:complete len:267 (+) Transcript_81032:3-803(+)